MNQVLLLVLLWWSVEHQQDDSQEAQCESTKDRGQEGPHSDVGGLSAEVWQEVEEAVEKERNVKERDQTMDKLEPAGDAVATDNETTIGSGEVAVGADNQQQVRE